MKLELASGETGIVSDVADLARRLSKLDSDTNYFAVLSQADEQYLQTTVSGEGFVIERRDGEHRAHFSAFKASATEGVVETFSKLEVIDIFSAYFAGDSFPSNVQWQDMKMPHPNSVGARIHLAKQWAPVVAIVIGVIGGLAARWF